jgi:DNA repair protein RecN (Recombination protein N)
LARCGEVRPVIHELRLAGLGVIAETSCQFAPGFTAVTGETGAGKTMVVTGLGLLAGGRSDPGLVRSGSARAAVEGSFDVPVGAAAQVVSEAGGLVDEDGLAAARIVAARGRSVLGGRTVPNAVLAEAMGHLLVIHGQHDQTRIGARSLALLDAYAGPEAQRLAAEVAREHARVRAAERELAELRTSARERARELDLLEHSLEEIAAVDPQPGEDRSLAAEAERLENADALVGAALSAREEIAADVDVDGAPDVMSRLSAARRALDGAAEHDSALGAQAEAIRSAMAQLGEVAADLSRYAEDVDADPRRLAALQDRRADLGRLTRKYGETADEVLAWAATAAARAGSLAGADDRIAALESDVAAARAELAALCADLGVQRRAAADRFAGQIAGELEALAMPRARIRFDVALTPDPEGLSLPGELGEQAGGPVAVRSTGVDEVSLLLAANPGAPMRPIAQAASGGELSRVMLAIQVVLAGADPVPTMVFDEVDAGVGGAAAIEVGRRLQQLSARTQVIVVTHLAQVAAFADRQLVVTKDSEGAITESSVVPVSGEDRVRELSRMLAGLADSEAAGAHARELLGMAHRASLPGSAGAGGPAR